MEPVLSLFKTKSKIVGHKNLVEKSTKLQCTAYIGATSALCIVNARPNS